MVNIRSRDQQKSGSPKGEVGEIDTRAPFQSVKAAVSLFGTVAILSKDKEKLTTKKSIKLSSENVLDKEAQLLLVQRELDKYKGKFQIAQASKARAYSELEKAKKTLNDLTTRLKIVNKTKLSAIEVVETVKQQAKQLEVAKSQRHSGNAARKQELEEEREKYMMIVSELDVAKQELTKLKQDFDAIQEAKSASFQQATEAQRLANINIERVNELSKEIKAMQESSQELKIASIQIQEQQAKILAEKDAYIQACKINREQVNKKLVCVKQEYYDLDLTIDLKVKLAETIMQIETLQQEIKKAHAFEMDTMKLVTAELNEATKMLQQVVEEENLLRNKVTSLKLELEDVIKDRIELEKQAEKEKEQMSKIEELSSEAETARREVEEISSNTNNLRQETEKARLKVKEVKEKIELALREIKEAKEAEKKAHDEMKSLSERCNAQNEESNNIIKFSLEEFETLKKKMEECESIAEAKETSAKAQVKDINETKILIDKKLEENMKVIEELKEATDIALKSAEMAEAAQNVIEGELRRWHHNDEH